MPLIYTFGCGGYGICGGVAPSRIQSSRRVISFYCIVLGTTMFERDKFVWTSISPIWDWCLCLLAKAENMALQWILNMRATRMEPSSMSQLWVLICKMFLSLRDIARFGQQSKDTGLLQRLDSMELGSESQKFWNLASRKTTKMEVFRPSFVSGLILTQTKPIQMYLQFLAKSFRKDFWERSWMVSTDFVS